MKKALLLTLISISLLACTSDDIEGLHNTWKLYSITENDSPLNQNTDDIIDDRIITISNDSIFKRVILTDYGQKQIEGTYSIINFRNNKYLILEYYSPNSIIGNCSNNLNEVYLYNSENQMTNIWHECGGPILEYRKID